MHPKISVAQIKYFDIDKKHNVEKIKKYIRLAKLQGSDIVCFPEICITKKESLNFSHKLIKEIQNECKKNSIWCIVTDEFKIGKKDYNIAVLINRNGKIAGHYKKINLYGEDMSAGSKVKVFQTDFAKIGIAICWDLSYPELFAKMKKKGAQIVFVPALWWYETWAHERDHRVRETKLLRSLIHARAFENLFYVALCNPVTDANYQVSYSAIASPHHIERELSGREGMVTAAIDLSKIKKYSRLYPGKRLP